MRTASDRNMLAQMAALSMGLALMPSDLVGPAPRMRTSSKPRKAPETMTDADKAGLARAEAKRERRRARNRALLHQTDPS